MLVLVGGIGTGAWLLLPSLMSPDDGIVQETGDEGDARTEASGRNWNMTQQGTPSQDAQGQTEETVDEAPAEPKYGIRDNAVDVTVPPSPREAEELTGTIGYDDIPSASQIEGGYTSDDLKDALIHHIQIHYPGVIVSDVKLIGNGSELSQARDEMTSWASYVVSFNNGMTKGFSITCSPSTFPYVNESNDLVVNQGLLYKVDEDEYVQMNITGEERIPEGTVIDHY